MIEKNSKTIKNKAKQGFATHPENINRNGRPKKGLTLTDVAKEILEEELPNGVTRKEALMRKIATLAFEGNETMIKLIWNYVDGMPLQKTNVSGDLAITKLLTDLTSEEDNEDKA